MGESFENVWDALFDDLENYVKVNNIVYLVQKEDVSCEDIFQAEMTLNKEISFLVQYYNGGCGFQEAIEKATKGIDTN